MKNAIAAELEECKLQNIPHTMTKVIQLYETKTSRHSVMIVGNTQSGKTVSWKVLQAAMSRLNRDGDPNFQQVKVCAGKYTKNQLIFHALSFYNNHLCLRKPYLVSKTYFACFSVAGNLRALFMTIFSWPPKK